MNSQSNWEDSILNRQSDEGRGRSGPFPRSHRTASLEKWAPLLTAGGGTAIYHITASREQDVMSTVWTSELESKPYWVLPRPTFTLFSSNSKRERALLLYKVYLRMKQWEPINLLSFILSMKTDPTLVCKNLSPKQPGAPIWFLKDQALSPSLFICSPSKVIHEVN